MYDLDLMFRFEDEIGTAAAIFTLLHHGHFFTWWHSWAYTVTWLLFHMVTQVAYTVTWLLFHMVTQVAYTVTWLLFHMVTQFGLHSHMVTFSHGDTVRLTQQLKAVKNLNLLLFFPLNRISHEISQLLLNTTMSVSESVVTLQYRK